MSAIADAVRWAEEIMKENSNADSVIFDGYSGLPFKRPSLSRRSSTRGTDTYQLDLGFPKFIPRWMPRSLHLTDKRQK